MAPHGPTTCLITGASRGIGLGVARRLDRAGYRLALVAQSKDSWQKLCCELDTFTGKDHVPIQCDVSDEGQISAMFAELDRTLGPLDTMVANSGIYRQEPSMEIQAADWDHLFAINVRGMMLCCREAARRMNGRGGSIVVTGSISGERPVPQRACYCAAKAAVHNYVQTVALEWAPLGIRVNVIAAGPIDTDFLNGAVSSRDGRERLIRLVPIGRLGTPDDVAAAAEYLLSDEAGFVTGAILRIDGGRVWT